MHITNIANLIMMMIIININMIMMIITSVTIISARQAASEPWLIEATGCCEGSAGLLVYPWW